MALVKFYSLLGQDLEKKTCKFVHLLIHIFSSYADVVMLGVKPHIVPIVAEEVRDMVSSLYTLFPE